MKNIKFCVAYNGSEYCGWQIQPGRVSIQKILSDVLSEILNENNLIVRAAGRTDSGVHARGQICSAIIDNNRIPLDKLETIYNKKLPQEIRVYNIEHAPDDFHPTINAISRQYCYRMSPYKDVFRPNVLWYKQMFCHFNINKLDSLFSFFVGEKNFFTFSKSCSNTDNYICNVEFAKVEKNESIIEFHIKANRFVHNMVRRLVGTVIDAHDKGLGNEYLEFITDQQDRRLSGKTMPARGLTLEKVCY